MNRLGSFLFLILLSLSCNKNNSEKVAIEDLVDSSPEQSLTDGQLLDFTQQETFRYFWEYAEINSGAARERYLPETPEFDAHIVATGGSGFGIMAMIVAIERGFISRAEGVSRLQKILGFFESADRFHGAWPHWLDGRTGKVIPFSPQDDGGDLVETAFLAQGLICVQEYFKAGTATEVSLATQAENLWKGVEWDWYTQGENTLYWHWSPNFDFAMDFALQGYNEVLITYLLAGASPDHKISPETYSEGWGRAGTIKSNQTAYGLPLEVDHLVNPQSGGPLFWAHYSFLGLNPFGLADAYVNYETATVNHAEINYRYCVENPKNFRDYGEDCWGLTASYTRNADGSLGYAAHDPNNDPGVISPTAALSSFPYTPEASMRALRYFYGNRDKLKGPAGFYDAFSPEHDFWVAKAYLAIDQGPIVVMIENYRSGLLWNLFMGNEDVQEGLAHLGITSQ